MLASMLVHCVVAHVSINVHISLLKYLKKKIRPHSRPLHSIVCIYYCIERKGGNL